MKYFLYSTHLKLRMQVVHLGYLFKLTVASICQTVMQLFGFPQTKDFSTVSHHANRIKKGRK